MHAFRQMDEQQLHLSLEDMPGRQFGRWHVTLIFLAAMIRTRPDFVLVESRTAEGSQWYWQAKYLRPCVRDPSRNERM